MEKINKRLKAFLDPTQKYKNRFASLQSLFESNDEEEIGLAYREYPELMITFVIESHNYTLEKLSTDKDFQGKFERSLGRDLDEYYKVPLLTERCLRYLRADLPSLPQCDQLINIIRTLLHPNNHPALRRDGCRLLMTWLRDPSSVSPELDLIFGACVQLSDFVEEGDNVFLKQAPFPLVPPNAEPAMFPAPVTVTPMEQSLTLFNEIFSQITYDDKADKRSTLHLYSFLRKHYLTRLYPEVFVHSATERPTEGFLSGCPEQVQAVIMKYFAMWTVQSPEFQTGGVVPAASFILQDVLLCGAVEDLQLVQEVIRQTLLLPFNYKPIIKVAINILRTWIFCPKERRPNFLQDASEKNPIVALLAEAMGISEVSCLFDMQLRKYIDMVSLIFDGRPSNGCTNEQMDLYREGIYFLRGLGMKVFFMPSRETQDFLLEVVLDIADNHLALQHKYAVINNTVAAEDFSQLLAETLFGLWIRLECNSQRHWEMLASILSVCTDWAHIVTEWSKVVLELTTIMGDNIFTPKENVEIQPQPSNTPRRRALRSGAFEGNNLGALSQGPLAKALPTELVALLAVTSAPAVAPISPDRSKSPAAFERDRAPKVDAFLNWGELAWTKENVVFLWKNMLRALGDINVIERADIHETAVLCLMQVYDRLAQLREAQPYFYRPLPPLYEFAVPLFEVCDLPGRTHERSRCVAYATICRMFTRRLDLSFPDEYFNRFYLSLIHGLSDKDDPVASVILLNASNIFARNLPGSQILVAPFLKCIAGILNSQIPKERAAIMVPIMRIAENIAILPDVFTRLSVPRIEAPLPIMSAIPIICAGEIELDAIKMQVKDLLSMLDYQEYTRNDPPVHAVLLCTIGMLLLNELLAYENPSEGLVDGLLMALLDHLLPKDALVLPVIFDQLSSLANLLPHYSDRFGQEREVLVMQRIVTAARSSSLQEDHLADELTSKLVMLLLDWIMTLPCDWLVKHASLREQIFSVLGDCVSSKRKLSKETANYCLIHISHHLRSYPPEPTASFNSCLAEPDWTDSRERVLYFTLGQAVIIAIRQLPSPSGQDSNSSAQVRIIVRNAAGRFSWDALNFFETFDHRASTLFKSDERRKWREVGKLRNLLTGAVRTLDCSLSLPTSPFASNESDEMDLDVPSKIIATAKPFRRNAKEIPMYATANADLEQVDMLAELLNYLTEEHADSIELNQRESLTQPEPINVDRVDEIRNISNYCASQIQDEKVQSQKYARSALMPMEDLLDDDYQSKQQHERAKPDERNFGTALPYQACRQFLTNFGFLALSEFPERGDEGQISLQILPKTASMLRDLKGLDKCSAREMIKIAIFYVATGQEDESSVLKNGKGSPAYCEFVRSLGWSVDLASHTGFSGGLEPNCTTDGKAIYYCNSLVECIFHDSTHLCANPSEDNRVLSKKRHLGNDHVYIIWNEHYRDYRPSIMRGDYGNAQIVITPTGNHLYHIQVYYDAGVDTFGPLFDGVIVPRALLGPLVRNTAISANRAVLRAFGLAPTRHPMCQRADDLSLIVQRHAQKDWSMEKSLNYLLFAQIQPDELSTTTTILPVADSQLEATEQVLIADMDGLEID